MYTKHKIDLLFIFFPHHNYEHARKIPAPKFFIFENYSTRNPFPFFPSINFGKK